MENKIDLADFKECKKCERRLILGKPLCKRCKHNQELIDALTNEIDNLDERIGSLRRALERYQKQIAAPSLFVLF